MRSKREVNMKSIISPSFLKQKARQLKKEKSINQHQALDEAAKLYGFSNYKHYLNVLEMVSKRKVAHFKNISFEKDLFKKIELTVNYIHNFKMPFHEQLEVIQLFHDPAAVQSLCEKLGLMKGEIEQFLFNDFLTDEGKYEITFRAPHFIAKKLATSDLTYEIQDGVLCVDGQYILTTEFEYELDASDPISKDERFNDRELFGHFEVRVDKNKKITIEHSDIGEEIDGSFSLASFR